MTLTSKIENEAIGEARLIPIFEATGIPVRFDGALPQQPSDSFRLTIEPERAQDMFEATQDAVRHLGLASLECKALEIKNSDGGGMILSIDRIRRGEVILPFICPQRVTANTGSLGLRAPKRGWLVHPDRSSWGALAVAKDGLVLLIGATTFLGHPVEHNP